MIGIKTMRGIDMIVQEREDQLVKHEQTIEQDYLFNKDDELIEAIFLLTASFNPDNYSAVKIPPVGWDETVWHHILQKSKIDKLAVIGAFAAAEIDRQMYEDNIKNQ